MNVQVKVEGAELPGLARLRERMNDASRSVLVGVPKGAATEADGTPMAVVAATHEFGDPDRNIPERSVLRAGLRRGAPKFQRLNEINLRAIVRGEMSVDMAIQQLGVVATGEVKREFVVGELAPLKPATIEQRKRKFGKASSRPLVASGNYRQAITFEIEGQQSANARIIE